MNIIWDYLGILKGGIFCKYLEYNNYNSLKDCDEDIK